MTRRTLTRRDFLKVAGAGAAGATMLGAAGCGAVTSSLTQMPEEYLPSGGSRVAYHDHVWARDERYVMFARHDGAEAKLFDLTSDPKMNKNIAGNNSDVVKNMFQGYVLKDAGGPLPSY